MTEASVSYDDATHACGPACLLATRWLDGKGLQLPLPALNDEEGPRLAASLPEVIDTHVHLFPDRVFEALWTWFDTHAWPVRYKLKTPEVVSFLLSRGVSRFVALAYAHRPGMADGLNRFLAELAASEPRVVALGTVLPGEPGAGEVVERAFELGLRGLKLHCHVQAFSPDDASMNDVYERCARHGKPLVMHAGREPSSAAYPVDPYRLCGVERIERVLTNHPRLKLCVPHLGADEYDGYERLLEKFDNLWLDTTMVATDYFPAPFPRRLFDARPERILFGTDFPNIPYAWDREVKFLEKLGTPPATLEAVLGKNARSLFGL